MEQSMVIRLRTDILSCETAGNIRHRLIGVVVPGDSAKTSMKLRLQHSRRYRDRGLVQQLKSVVRRRRHTCHSKRNDADGVVESRLRTSGGCGDGVEGWGLGFTSWPGI